MQITHVFRHVAMVATAGGLALCSACGSTSGHQASGGASQANTARACQALVALDNAGNQGPGGNGAPPSPAQVKQFAGQMQTLVGRFVAAAPAGPKTPAEKALATFHEAAGDGNVNLIDPAHNAALVGEQNSVEEWAHGSCGFEPLDVTGVDYTYRGVPQTLRAGTVSIKFTNMSTHGDHHEFQLLRIEPGSGLDATTLVAALRADPDKAQQIYGNDVDPVADAEAAPGQTGYTTATLTPGTYVGASFIGNPPQVTRGMIVTFRVT